MMRYKKSDPKEAREILRDICTAIRPRALILDATSERYWCAETATDLASICPVILIVNSERIIYEDQSMTYKSYLGNLAVNALEDYKSALPPTKDCKDDFRLVKRYRGGFDNDEDNSGNHGDTFDAYKNSIYGFCLRPRHSRGYRRLNQSLRIRRSSLGSNRIPPHDHQLRRPAG